MLADCIKHGDSRSDAPQSEAVLSGVFVAGEKLGFALGAMVAGGLLVLAGLVETQEGFVEQPNSAIWSIRLAVSVIPMVVNALALVVFWFYRAFDSRIVAPAPVELHSEQPSVS
jgi:Na+/melibiose symporter-like transporter